MKEGERITFNDPETGIEMDITIDELEDYPDRVEIKRATVHHLGGTAKLFNLPEGWVMEEK